MRSYLTLFHTFVLCIAFGVSSAPVLAQQAPDYAGLDHVEFFVTDLDRSLAFYTRLFGTDLWKNRQTERRYLMLGANYLALEERTEPVIDHICYGILDFNIDAVHQYLDREALAWENYPSGRDLRVDDRDGIRTQLAANNTWAQLKDATAAPQSYPQTGPPVFNALRLDEVSLSVTNLEVDSLHYARLLGSTGILQAGSLWFTFGNSRLRLVQTPVGEQPGVVYFSILISNTDLEAAADAVFAAGGIIENILPDGFSFWDPDGHRVVVHTANML